MATSEQALPSAPPARSARGRRNPRATGEDRERAIMQTAEQLLQERPLSEISVDDLARGAGISRPTFYFYFASKDAVVLSLIDGMVEQAEARKDEAVQELAENPRAGWRRGLEDFYEIFRSHRAVALAGAELRASNAEARALWAGIMQRWVDEVAAIVEGERARGAAPEGPPARELAVALVQMNERVQYASLGGESPAIAEERVLDVLLEVWLRAIYGVGDPR